MATNSTKLVQRVFDFASDTASSPAPSEDGSSLSSNRNVASVESLDSNQFLSGSLMLDNGSQSPIDVFAFRGRALPDLPQEGSPLCRHYSFEDRKQQVQEYIRRKEIILNRTNGVKNLENSTDKIADLERLKAVFYHYPYQVMDFLFRELPSRQGRAGNSTSSISNKMGREAVYDWACEFPHVETEVRSWIRNAISEHNNAVRDKQPGRPIRMGTNAQRALSFLYEKFKISW